MMKATIVLLAAWLVIPLLRQRSAAERHALWTAALTMASLLPVLTWLMPSWEPSWVQRAAETWPVAFGTSASVVTADDIVVRATGMEAGTWTRADTLVLLWVAGTVVLLIGLVAQVAALKRLASAPVVAPERHAEIAGSIAESLGLETPHLLYSPSVGIPLAWGVRRPRLLLPDSSRQWSDERVWAVCAHEMAHISRGDWLTHLLAEIACRIYWFNPLFWVARNRLGRESERAADDVVLGLGASGADYASHLVDIVRTARPHGGLKPTVAMARLRAGRFGGAGRGSGFERRVAALLSTLVNRARLTRVRVIAILTGALSLALPLAALGIGDRVTIDVQTSNLPALEGLSRDALADDGSEPVQEIRVLQPMTSGRDEAPSVAEYTTPPLYSDEARRRAVEGVVVAHATIDARGAVSEARIVSGLGFGLDQNALVALRQWRFRPGSRNGTAAAIPVRIEIAFTLRNDAINAQIANDMVSLVGPGVTPPQAVRVVNPRGRALDAAGTVVLDVVLLENGTPRIVRILRSLGPDADDLAVRAFEQWRFSPAQKDSRPIKVRMNAAVRFHG